MRDGPSGRSPSALLFLMRGGWEGGRERERERERVLKLSITGGSREFKEHAVM